VSPEEIAEALSRIERRQEEIERRLAALESKAGHRRLLRGLRNGERPAGEAATQPSHPRNFETAFGLVWISRIAVVTVVLALAFFFEYVFENHWVTAEERVVLGLAAGAVALLFGERFWRKGQRVFAQALTAAGIAFLYLSVWAAFGLYHLVSQPAAFGLMVAVTASAGVLALRYDAAAVALLGLAGGFATPLLLGGGKDPWFVLAYALVLDGGAAVCTRMRRWRWLEAMALAGTVVLYVSQWPPAPDMRAAYTLFVLVYYGLFAITAAPAVSIAAQVLAPAAAAEIWAPGLRGLWLAWAVAASGLVLADRRRRTAPVTGSFAGFWLAYAAWNAAAGWPAPVAALAPLTAAFLIFAAWPVWRVLAHREALGFQELLSIALGAAFYFGAGYELLRSGHGGWEGLFAVAIAVVEMAAARLMWFREGRGSLLAAGAAWVLLLLAAPIQFAGYRVTVAWAMEGAALTWIGVRLRKAPAVGASLAVFFLVFLRLALADSRMYRDPSAYVGVANARFLAFSVSAAALWAAAWWIRNGRRALAMYVGGHAVLLWGLCLEVAGWAARTAAPANLASVTSLSISVLAAGYAVLLVAAGAVQPHPPTRAVGTVLIGLVILKLYLYDVWLLGPFYRVAAFAILGVLLLAMSYLYSRFRGSIESWWRP
jgi:uncharacterized membrane protein